MSRVALPARFLLTVVLTGLMLSVLAFGPVGVLGMAARESGITWAKMPSDLKVLPAPQRTQVYASDGKTLLAVFYDENRRDVNLSRISPHMLNAIVAAEDQDFYNHPGYDIKGLFRAFVSNTQGGPTQGASTITMQYVRQALTYYAKTPQEVLRATEETPQRKIREIKYSVELEKRYTKQQILELYLNIAYFGHGAYGIYAASQVYFNKTPDKLTAGESALLAGLVRSPSAYDPITNRQAALDRREYVLAQMVNSGYLTSAEVVEIKKTKLKFYGRSTPSTCVQTYNVDELGAGFFCDYFYRWWMDNPEFGATRGDREVALMQGGYKVITTLDTDTQKAAHKYARNQPTNRVPKSQQQGVNSKNANMIVAVEPGTGRVLAMGVNRNFSNDQSKNGRNTNPNKRGEKGNYPNTTVPIITGSPSVPGYQAGSVFKIFTVVAALEAGYSPNLVINAPHQFVSRYPVGPGPASCGGYYCTSNANPAWMDGPNNMYTGFGRSVNTYFIPLQQHVGAHKSVDAAKRMGIKFRAKGTKSHPSDHEFANDPRLARSWGPFSLGVTAVTPLELANAYATIAAKGKYCEPTPVVSVVDRTGVERKINSKCNQAIDEGVAADAVDVARCPVGDQSKRGQCNGGTAEYVRGIVKRPVAGKSGTTDNERTATFIAMTPNMAVAGILADTDHPMTHRRMSHPPVNFAVVYTLRDGVKDMPKKNF